MRLIGLSGYKTSGKDTVYGFIDELVDDQTQRIAFADKLKIAAAKTLGFVGTEFQLMCLMNEFKDQYGLEIKHYGNFFHKLTGRQYLQWFGQSGRETFGEDFWVDQVLPKVTSKYNPEHYWNQHALGNMYPGVVILVVTDVRYPNEAKRIKDLGGEVWEVIRPGIESDGHASETALPRELINHQIVNDLSLEALRESVKDRL